MRHSPAPHSEFTAAEIEVVTGINVDVQKDLRKRIAAAGLRPLGKLRGHWRYSWSDLCFLKLFEAVKRAGLSVDNALEFVLRRETDEDGMRFRGELERVVAAHLVGLPMESDVCMYIPIDQQGWTMQAVLPIEFDGNRPVSGQPVSMDQLFSFDPACSHVAVVNVSRVVRGMIDHIGRMEPLLTDLEQHRHVLRRAFGDEVAE